VLDSAEGIMSVAELMARIAWLEKTLDDHVRWIFETARRSPPGGGPEWDRVLAHYGVAAESADFRRRAAAEMRLTSGAVVVEVRHALGAVERQIRAELDRLEANDAFDTMTPPFGALETRVAYLVEHESQKYAQMIRGAAAGGPAPAPAPVGGGVSSIFANAQATAAKVPWANFKAEAARVLHCSASGAPQEATLDFTCRYCRAAIGHKRP
jgi:hypothetical protein